MKHANRSTRRRQTVPWWKAQLSFNFEDPPPERAEDNPPSEPDRPQPVGCGISAPDSIPEDIRDLYVSLFGLPALHPANRCEAAGRRPVDADAASREVAA